MHTYERVLDDFELEIEKASFRFGDARLLDPRVMNYYITQLSKFAPNEIKKVREYKRSLNETCGYDNVLKQMKQVVNGATFTVGQLSKINATKLVELMDDLRFVANDEILKMRNFNELPTVGNKKRCRAIRQDNVIFLNMSN